MMRWRIISVVMIVLMSCEDSGNRSELLDSFSEYYTAEQDGTKSRWKFTTDTVKVWFDEKEGDPILQIKGKKPAGKWKEWDKEMHSNSYYDSLWYEQDEHAMKGYFYEQNDFYRLIGKPPTKTLRTYWLNKDDKIKEILIYWIPEENTSSDVYLKPVVKWAQEYDSLEISELYPEGKIIPSRENARRWKTLLQKYNRSRD